MFTRKWRRKKMKLKKVLVFPVFQTIIYYTHMLCRCLLHFYFHFCPIFFRPVQIISWLGDHINEMLVYSSWYKVEILCNIRRVAKNHIPSLDNLINKPNTKIYSSILDKLPDSKLYFLFKYLLFFFFLKRFEIIEERKFELKYT